MAPIISSNQHVKTEDIFPIHLPQEFGMESKGLLFLFTHKQTMYLPCHLSTTFRLLFI